MKHHRYLPVLLLLAAGVAAAQGESRLKDAGGPGGVRLAGTENPEQRKVYIVQLEGPSVAEFHARQVAAVAQPLVKTDRRIRLDKNSAAVQGYADRLEAEQDAFIAKHARGAEKLYNYRYGLNGFAAKMTAAEAHKLENMDGVLNVWEDEIRPLTTNFTPEFLGLFRMAIRHANKLRRGNVASLPRRKASADVMRLVNHG